MSLVTFNARLTNVKPKEKAPVKPKPAPAPAPVTIPTVNDISNNDMSINIVAVGRTVATVCDFVSSMNDNLTDVLSKEGLTSYTKDNFTLSSLVARKKAIERHFWSFNKNPFVVKDENTERVEYRLTVSPSGRQDRTLELNISCMSFHSAPALGGADAVWLIADGAALDESREYDTFREYLKGAVRGGGGAEKPVCLVLSQIEGYGRYTGSGEKSVMPRKIRQLLLEKCRQFFSGESIAVIPVQVYGGFEYIGTEDGESCALRISESGYYQSFIPDGCYLVPLYTMEKLMLIRETDVFGDIPHCSLRSAIKNTYGRKTDEGTWSPDML
ncbi:MAG: hypothetical protein IKL24_01725 [Clostridia bacterium]|nr:hypothetical protein [Clostridia bacterium]